MIEACLLRLSESFHRTITIPHLDQNGEGDVSSQYYVDSSLVKFFHCVCKEHRKDCCWRKICSPCCRVINFRRLFSFKRVLTLIGPNCTSIEKRTGLNERENSCSLESAQLLPI